MNSKSWFVPHPLPLVFGICYIARVSQSLQVEKHEIWNEQIGEEPLRMRMQRVLELEGEVEVRIATALDQTRELENDIAVLKKKLERNEP